MTLIIPTKNSGEITPETVVAGVPLLRRIVMAASRAGCTISGSWIQANPGS